VRKIVFIIFWSILLVSCSLTRKERTEIASTEIVNNKEDIIQLLRKNNLFTRDFYIKKAEIIFSTNEGTKKLFLSLKYNVPDKYLISLKTIAGMELSRIFISNDTILVNDRIKRIVYYGSPKVLKRKYGVPLYFIPIIFGDYIEDSKHSIKFSDCEKGRNEITVGLSEVKIRYIVDCKRGKVLETSIEGQKEFGVTIKQSSFHFYNNQTYSTKSEISKFLNFDFIEMNILKLESNFSDTIEFVPGKGYDKLEIL